MPTYNPAQISHRTTIIQSQKQFYSLLNADMINVLINLFDPNYDTNEKITTYIEEERRLRGYNDSNISIRSEAYGETNQNATLLLEIKKNNKEFLHLTIHLNVKDLNPKETGIIHISKNVYKMIYKGRTNTPGKKAFYALIQVHQPPNKPNSLEFTIADGYATPYIQHPAHDHEIQQEMDVVLTVLTRLFDEQNTQYYVGNPYRLFPIHNRTNAFLKNINMHNQHVTRRNKGIHLYPSLENGPSIGLKSRTNRRKYTRAMRPTKGTRKIHK